MFSKTAELYDVIYGSFKDYDAESERIASLLASVAPGAESVLDVGCGTGEHARHLSGHGYAVDGLDIEPGFVEVAQRKLPESRIWRADMAGFSLDRSYDVVLCLFSSIGYLCELKRVERALGCFRRHLNPGGVALVEPWFEPSGWRAGSTYLHSAESDSLKVARLSHSEVEGRISTLDFHYLIATAEGIEHRRETHRLGLFTRGEMIGCFERAGFDGVEYDANGLIGRGMYIARHNPVGPAPPQRTSRDRT